MIRRRIHLALAAVLAVAMTAWLGAACAADGPTTEGDERALRYRPILVPEDRIDEVLSKVRRYLSVEQKNFQRLIEKSRPARIVEAKYTARLVNETLLVGTARIEVECPEGQQAGLLLDGCRLPIENPLWQVDGDEKEALVGLDAQGRLVAAVYRSARLTFSWSLRGSKDASGVVRFPIALPSSPSSHFQCDLPAGKSLQSSEGVLEVGADGRPTKKSKSDGKELWTWPIRLGSSNRFSLQVASENVIRQRRRLTLVRQQTSYEISPRGVVLTTKLTLDVHDEALRHVTLLLDPLLEQEAGKKGARNRPRVPAQSLQLVRALYGNSNIPWSVQSRPSMASRVRLQLPEPIQGADRVLTLHATCPLPSRLDRVWRLPQIRCDKTFWQEGTTKVSLSAPLFIKGASALLGRQTPSLSDDSVSFEFFSPDAGLDILIDRGRGTVEARSGSAVEIGPARIACRWTARISCDRESRFELSADVPSEWVVDSVGPTEAIRRWQHDRKTGKLVLQLNRAITPQQPLSIVIGGHRASSHKDLGIDDFRFVTLRDANVHRRLMTIEAAPSYQLKLKGAEELNRLDPEFLGKDAGLFEKAPQRLLFEVDEGAERLEVSWADQTSSFDASVSVDANLRGSLLKETYRIRCVPGDSQVAKLRVRFSIARTAPPRWSLVGESATALRAAQLSRVARGHRRLLLRGEVWELTLPKATAQPFEIVATRSSSLQEPLRSEAGASLSLASLPQASSQQGTLTIRSGKPLRLQVNHRRLTAVPVAPAADGRYQAVRAKFTYDPQRETPSASAAVAIFLAGDPVRHHLAWVWSSFHQSRFSPQGNVEHLATFHIQNTGREQITLVLPEASTRHTLWVNQQQQAPAIDGNRLTLGLPEGQRFPTVTLHYTTKGPPLAVSQRVRADLVEVDEIPHLHRRWKVWVPPGYEVSSCSPQQLDDISRKVTWSQRLFGPLGRAANRETFDPLDSEAWTRLVRQPEQQAAARRRVRQLLTAIGSPPAGNQNWGDLLTFAESSPNANEDNRDSHPPLLIDWRSLSRLELTPTTVVPSRPSAEQPSRSSTGTDGSNLPDELEKDVRRTSLGVRTLKVANLVLLVQPDAIVLTTRSVAAKYHQVVIELEEECVYWVPPGRLRDRMQQAARPAQDAPGASLLDVATWKTVPAVAALPWDSLEQREGLSADHLGWTVYDFDLSGGDSPPSPRVVHRTSMQTLGYAIALLVIVAWWWFARLLEKKRKVLVWTGDGLRWIAAKLGMWPAAARWWPSRSSNISLFAADLSGVALPCMALGVLGAVAMLAHAGLTPITSGLFLGTLAAVLLRPLARHVGTPARTESTESTVSVTRLAGIALWLISALLVGFTLRTATAQQPSEGPVDATAPSVRSDKAAAARPVPRVFVPIDAQRRATGDVWVPKQFYDALRRRESHQTGQPRRWLLRSARYRGALDAQDGETARLKYLRVEIELWTFAANTTVRVAIPRDLIDPTAKPALRSKYLSKDSVSLRWDAVGDVATFDVKQAGRHQLIVPLRLRVEHDASTEVSQFDVAIPALASSVIQLDTPSQISLIDAPSALGAVQYDKDKDKQQFSAVLGATDRLKIRWSSRPQRARSPAQFNVEQLIWLTVRPNSVTVEAKFHVAVTKGRLRTLEIVADKRLRLLPSGPTQWPVKKVTFHEGQRSLIRLELDRPVDDTVDIYAKFLLTGASGVGELRQPTLEAVGARSLRRWLAVSVDLGLKSRPGKIGRGVRSISPDDFLGKWGDQEAVPELAYQLPKGEVPWSLKTSPESPRTTVDETLIVSLRRQSARLRFSATLATIGGVQFQYRVQVPPEMTVDRLLVQQAGVARPSRWTDDGRGGLVVFLIGPVQQLPQQLIVEGHIATPGQGKWKVPSIHVEGNNLFAKDGVDVQVTRRRIGVYRRPGVLVEIDRADGLSEVKQAAALPQSPRDVEEYLGRLVAWFEKKAGGENLRLSLRPNQPKVIASQLTTIEKHQDKWSARLDFHIEQITADSGVVDVLRFIVPKHWDDWDGSLEVNPTAAISLERRPGETSQQLVVRPTLAVDGPFHLTVTGLSLAKDQRVALPDILPLGLGDPRRFVMLPGKISAEQFQWEPQDLRKLPFGELPPLFRIPQRPQSTFTSYEVVKGGQPQATRRSVQQTFGDPLVRLMDVTVAWQTDGSCQGTVLYDLEPAGMTDVRLELPAGYRFVAARVAGLEASAQSESETLWRIPLASAQLPQRIEVTFTAQMASGNDYRPHLEAPRLLEVGVERTLWTVYAPPTVGVGQLENAAHLKSALAHARARLRSLTDLIEEEAPVAARSSPEQLAAWYRPWAERLFATRRELRRQPLTAAEARAADLEDGDFDRRQSQISPQIQSILNELSRTAPTERGPNQLWRLDFEQGQIATRCAFIGEANALSLQYAPTREDDLAVRIVVALLMLTFSAAVLWGACRGFSIPSPIRWGHALTVAAGIAWWLWLSPSLLGGLIVLFAVASAVWPLRRGSGPWPWSLGSARRTL